MISSYTGSFVIHSVIGEMVSSEDRKGPQVDSQGKKDLAATRFHVLSQEMEVFGGQYWIFCI